MNGSGIIDFDVT